MKIVNRVAKLEDASRPHVTTIVWRDPGETQTQALARWAAQQPAGAVQPDASSVLVVGWTDATPYLAT